VAIKETGVVSDIMSHHDPAIIVAIYETVATSSKSAVLDIDVARPIGVTISNRISSGPRRSVGLIFDRDKEIVPTTSKRYVREYHSAC
jgi:hypothetical protein